jgi:hypothetical protein
MVQISTGAHITAVLRMWKLNRGRLTDHFQIPLNGRTLETERLRYESLIFYIGINSIINMGTVRN